MSHRSSSTTSTPHGAALTRKKNGQRQASRPKEANRNAFILNLRTTREDGWVKSDTKRNIIAPDDTNAPKAGNPMAQKVQKDIH